MSEEPREYQAQRVAQTVGKPLPKMTNEEIQSFWGRVSIGAEDDCWNWLKGKFASGYGQFFCQGKPYRSHRLAYYISKGDFDQSQLMRHTCDNPACCNPNHLIPGTAKENTQDALRRGRIPLGELSPLSKIAKGNVGQRNPFAKIRDLEIFIIRHFAMQGVCNAWIAQRFKVHPRTIFVILSGDSRKHFKSPLQKQAFEKARTNHYFKYRGENSGAAKLCDSKVRAMRAASAGGKSYRQISQEFGVPKSTVSLVITKRTWKHLS